MMATRFSLATRPPTAPTVACQVPKPSGAKMKAMAPPTAARMELLLSSTMPKAPFSLPKLCRNQMMMVLRRMTVNARLMKLQPRSQVECRTFLAEGA